MFFNNDFSLKSVSHRVHRKSFVNVLNRIISGFSELLWDFHVEMSEEDVFTSSVPPVGFEPTTTRSSAGCSPAELQGLWYMLFTVK